MVTIGSRRAWVLAPVLCLFLYAEAQATCAPVVYVFRHAEDSNALPYPNTLTKTGQRHADLYVAMVGDINTALGTDFCPVTKVYAINLKKEDGSGNTTNPFLTAKPLAIAAMGRDPLEKVADGDTSYPLLEYLGNSPSPSKNTSSNPFVPSYTTKVAVALRDALIATAQAGESSAIFWTSQGMHVLAGAIIDGDSKVPQKVIEEGGKSVAFPPGTPIGTPPRNSTYILPYDAAKAGFNDVTRSDQHVQCYNWTMKSSDGDTEFRTDYWCGNANYGDLGGNPKSPSLIKDADLGCVHARICDTGMLSKKGSAYYGSCPSGEPKVTPPC